MPWFPVKKVRKRMKLLLLLLLLTCAAWLTYVHLSLARQGRALRQRPGHARGRGRGAAGPWRAGGVGLGRCPPLAGLAGLCPRVGWGPSPANLSTGA